MKPTFLWLFLFIGATIWIIDLRRRLQAAEMRGNMYRDISARLDRRLTELTAQQPAVE